MIWAPYPALRTQRPTLEAISASNNCSGPGRCYVTETVALFLAAIHFPIQTIRILIFNYREIAKITEPIRKFQNQWSKQSIAMQKAVEPAVKLQEALAEPLKNFQKSFEIINKIYASIPKFENLFLEHLDIFKEIGERLKEYAENTPKNFLLIAQYGWFIDLESEVNFPSKVAHHILENEIVAANESLAGYYKTNLERIFERLIKRHHNRKGILGQIKRSFEDGSHYLLIPSVLTQVDGICFDFTKRKFFIKERKNNFLPQVTSELEKSAGDFWNCIYHPYKIRHR